MIYSTSELCTCTKCGKEYGENAITLNATIGCVLLSSGEGRFLSSVLCAGSLVVFSGEITLELLDGAHIIYSLLAGAAAEKASQGLVRPCVSDCGACPMAAEIMTMLLEDNANIPRSRLSFELLCELAGANEKTSALPALVAQALSEMHKSYAQLFGVEELSQSLGVSKSHLVRVFSQHMGMPPGQYLTRVRIDAAKVLLSQRNYSLELVATLCGFSGANYLCKVFRREAGQTPAAYRRAALASGSKPTTLTDLEGTLFV